MKNQIEHIGTIQKIAGDTAYVLVEQSSACSACHAKASCTASDSVEKIIETQIVGDEKFHEGEYVKVIGERKLGLLAVLLAFVFPFSLIIVVLLTLNAVGLPENWSGTLALASLVPYYLILALFKKKLKRQFQFYVQKIEN
ncbi:MAG: SoxR reducing system RseC family protein [Paludibacteraceae bacterium]|jgi:sigma-E factor negative regulatory protein RseC|nr:SoxR reducing system RseC family protein [Paludibacteraceae bacterium]MDI9537000.1 SoxR reducing system RseC family protein [Bacteroidota bacterium]HHT61365.1 SoxR reducing system RseC family protein [Bacteroidales bacterium]MBP9039271.1 SoxR reducing system RseC family protein [Paludibacteraceae bacterium]HOA47076.1 SoxR reducing system RseC family protein [Paludibacteraceae bacterium]